MMCKFQISILYLEYNISSLSCYFVKLKVPHSYQADNTFPFVVVVFISFLTNLCFDPPFPYVIPLHYEFPPPSVIYTAAFHFLLALAPLRVREEGRASQLVGGGLTCLTFLMPTSINQC